MNEEVNKARNEEQINADLKLQQQKKDFRADIEEQKRESAGKDQLIQQLKEQIQALQAAKPVV